VQWLMPVISATQNRQRLVGSRFMASLGKKWDLHLKNNQSGLVECLKNNESKRGWKYSSSGRVSA
jgi:hypothetical protein